jgi:hypothetical protein
MRFAGDLNLGDSSKIRNAIVVSGNTFPTPSEGELFLHEGQADPLIESGLYIYKSSDWRFLISLERLVQYNEVNGASVKIVNSSDVQQTVKVLRIAKEFSLVDMGSGTFELQPQQLYFSGTNAVTTINTNNALVYLPINTELIKDSVFTHSNTVDNSKVTVTSGTVYNANFTVTCSAGTDTEVQYGFYKNGTLIVPVHDFIRSSRTVSTSFQIPVSMVNTDYLQIGITKLSGNQPLSVIAGASVFNITRVKQ